MKSYMGVLQTAKDYFFPKKPVAEPDGSVGKLPNHVRTVLLLVSNQLGDVHFSQTYAEDSTLADRADDIVEMLACMENLLAEIASTGQVGF